MAGWIALGCSCDISYVCAEHMHKSLSSLLSCYACGTPEDDFDMDRGESLEASGTSTESSKPTGIDASTTESDGLPPFDIEEDDGGGHFAFDKDSNEDEDGEFFEAQEGHLPTMPGYDESVSRNRNCFSEPDISIFSVRGIDYFESSRKKKKVQSGPFLLRARGCDLFLFERSEECDLSNR